MQELRFKLVSRGSGQNKLHVITNVTNAAGAVQYCLILVIGRSGQKLALQDLKQASSEDVANYLLNIFKSDTETSTVQFDLNEENLVQDLVEGVIVLLGRKLLGLTEDHPVAQVEKARQYMTNAKGSTAWAGLIKPGKSAAPGTKAPPAKTAVPRPGNPALSRSPAGDEPSLDSILGGDSPLGNLGEPEKQKLEKLENVPGVEGKLVRFTTRYSKLILEMSERVKAAPKGDLKSYAAIARNFAPGVAQVAAEATSLPPEYFVSQSAAKVEKALNQLYIHRLTFNLPEIRDKGKGDLSKILTMDLSGARKTESHSITVDFLFQKRFGVPPELGDTLRDLLRFSWGMPVACDESFPYVTRKVDLTKLYYVYSGSARPMDTDIFFFRELDGRCGMVYVPYQYLGTGILNALLFDFFSRPWQQGR
ncbi:MAG: hypothetical protein KIT79_14170 [Deltaproteobacteria bacterium]|nr:hypothetical protein [Deltaproteobacteria bacterium]